MICLTCHYANEDDARFCEQCGQALNITCPSCGSSAIAGYTALSAQVGEEALFALMDELYELLIHEVHRYEGTMNELTGDGLVAFFGAPLAVEQAPQRAVRAALALQEAVMHYSARVERKRGVHLQLRVGLNTGPVIVGTVGNNLRMENKAIGNTVNL